MRRDIEVKMLPTCVDWKGTAYLPATRIPLICQELVCTFVLEVALLTVQHPELAVGVGRGLLLALNRNLEVIRRCFEHFLVRSTHQIEVFVRAGVPGKSPVNDASLLILRKVVSDRKLNTL